MTTFETYLSLGFQHISDLNGYDHILFILALCALYRPSDWKKVIGLVTAFTIGHSITLALSTLHIVLLAPEIIEFLIPVTIFITALSNFIFYRDHTPVRIGRQYTFALFFGLIHGMGFSNYLKMLLGKESHIFEPLLAFNVGLEIGQLLIVFAFMLLTWLVTNVMKLSFRYWMYLISGITAILSVSLMSETKFW